MKVLFISSAKSGTVGEVVLNQGRSLEAAGVKVDYFLIKPGFTGYLAAIPAIRRKITRGDYNLAHAHYSLSAFAASLSGRLPLIVSLMGSDVFMSRFLRVIAHFFYIYRWDATIVKTSQMKEVLKMREANIIPNGVNVERFKPIPKREARRRLNYPMDKKIVIFISAPNRPEKNLELADSAILKLNNPDIEFKHIYNVSNSDIPYYLNAADVLLLTSKWEGSVNIIKEAMACNCPIVSTDVGDVRWVIGKTEGCYLTSFDSLDVLLNLQKAIVFGERTEGRKRLKELGLDSESVADRILAVYKKVLEKN